ncbi:MAG: hypothetical protein KAI69_03885 [Deltaproteobacteria bacterium]|nr:hypothetical protein [Deltaproteobacteria bacterium]
MTVAILSTITPVCNAAVGDTKPLIGAQISILEGDNWRACDKYFQKLKELGYNTIILRVFHNRNDRFHKLVERAARKQTPEGVYFSTDQAPIISDILTPACKSAHRAGLKIFAWMTTLKANYDRSLRPQVLYFDKNSGSIKREDNLLDPASPENIEFLKKLFQDLAVYPIDGILLQDDLILRHDQGFALVNGTVIPDPEDIYQFSDIIRAEITAYRPPFYRWRQQQALTLQHLANTIFATCRSLRPELLCAQNIHYELLLNDDWGRDWFACSKESLTASKADYLMVMAYQERIRRELEVPREKELSATMLKIFENGLGGEKERIIFKFETPNQEDSRNRKLKLIATLQKTIRNARKKGWRDLILTPCNNPEAAALIRYNAE